MNGKSLPLPNNLRLENKGISAVKSLFSNNIKSFLLLCLLGVSALSFAQSIGPAGVNNGIRLWLDASDLDGDGIVEGIGESGIVIGADTNVVEWRDKSGVLPTGSPHFTSPTSAFFTDSAKYKLQEADFNGRTTVEFGPGSALYHELLTPWSGSGTHTVFIVLKQKSLFAPSGAAIFSSGIDTVNTVEIDEHFQISSDSAAGMSFAYYTTGGGMLPVAEESNFGLQTAANAAPTFYTARRSASEVVTHVDGAGGTTVAFGTNGDVFDQYLLNANRDTSITNDCYIAEVIIYDVVLVGVELQRVHDYLYCKYITAFDDTMPGGISPCSVSLWLKADGATSTTLSGSDVDVWSDQSNYGFNGTETMGNRPTFIPSDNNFNPSINFDDTDNERLNLGNSPASVADFDALTMGINDFSVYAVAKHDPTYTGTLFADNFCDESNGYRINYDASDTKWKFDGVVVNGSNSLINSANPETDTTETPYGLIKFERSGTDHIVQTSQGDINSATSSPTLTLSANNNPTERWVGKRSNQGSCGNSHFDGNISELLIVRNTVSDDEDKKIQSYLGIKYGLTVNSSLGNYLASDGVTDLWTFTSHWNDVAGIGQDDGSLLHQRVGKSQHPTGIITMALDADFTSANDGGRTPIGDGNFLIWGNNNTPGTAAWAVGAAPVGYAILPEIWRVKKTGSPSAVELQVDVDDPDNDMPGFVGDLYLVHGADISSAVPLLMTENPPGSGLWTRSGVNFSDSAYFTFAVKNDLEIEFSYPNSASVNEQLMDTFPDVLATGIVNVASQFDVNHVSGSAFNDATGTGPDFTYVDQTIMVDTGSYVLDTFPLAPPTLTLMHQDPIDEGFETALMRIIVGSGIVIGDVDGVYSPLEYHTFTITDDDSYQIEIGTPTDGAEAVASTPATFVVSMAGAAATNTSGADITGTITYTGTAMNGVDYTTQDTFVLLMNDPSVTITLPVLDDMILEGDETIIATIASSVGAIALVPPATATISDDEETSIEVSIGSPVDVDEGLGSVQFTVSLSTSNQTGFPITGDINYTTGPGNAIDGTDFTGTATWSIADGASSGSVISPTTGDDLVENTEPVIAIISNPSVGNVHPTFFTDTAYIFDEDTTALQISLTSGVTTVVEGPGVTIDYLVTLDGMKINGTGAPITGTMTLTGTALPPGVTFPDYSNTSPFSFGIPDGAGSVVVPINITDDGEIEPPKTVIGSVSGLSVGTLVTGVGGVSVSLLDNDAGASFISIGSPTDTTESPMGAPYISYVVFLEGGLTNTTGSVITGAITYSGTATPVLDYTAIPSYAIGIGDNSDTIVVPVINNGATEPPETVTAFLSGAPSSGGMYANTTATANILDDDAANLTISVNTPVDGGEGTGDASFVVSLDGGLPNGSGSTIFGTISYSGTAVASSDYVVPPGTFSIPNGELTDTIFIDITDDQVVEYTEDVIAVLSSPSVGTISSNDSVTVTIDDNDAGGLLLSIDTPVDGMEGSSGSDVSFLISMNGGALTNGLGVPLTGTVTFGGTAIPSLDFVNTTTFSIPDGSSSEPFVLSVFDDFNIEPVDTVIATISAPLLGNIGALSSDTALIFDNDTTITLNIEAVLNGVEFPTPFATDPQFRVVLGGGLTNELGTAITGDISYLATSTATEGVDYTSIPNFSIANTNSEDIITLTIIDDPLEESTETIIATISSPSLGTIGTMDVATVNISDDDTDTDKDGLIDLLDSNDVNIDTDCDGIFDGCDADHDGDGNIDQGLDDFDGDGIHDGCDASIVVDGVIDNGPDINLDDLNDIEWDPTDDDGDLLPNHVDPNDNNPDSDGDGIPDGADVDVNQDGIFDNGCDVDDDGINDVADSDDNPTDLQTDVGNEDEDEDGIDNYWDLVNDNAGGQAINYIVTPDGDGVNDVLRIKGINFFENHELIIFNRWGTPIYTKRDYQQDWAGEITEGIIIGTEPAIDGTYYYTLDLGNGQEFVRGFIEIRR